MKCAKHNLKKDWCFCLKTDCEDRLVCKKCFTLDQKHHSHKLIYLDYFMADD